jgi:hypothetical protein
MLHLWHIIQSWLAIHTGTYIPPGQYSDWYNFWSGFGSDIAEFGLLATLVGIYRHHNCAVPRCPRFGHHEVKGTHYKTCHKHATLQWHKRLQQDHSEQFPDQHKFLKGRSGS